jgi:plasmid stabilization system protein ParE
MSVAVRESEFFPADVGHYFRWYLGEAGEETAWRFQTAVVETIARIARNPTIGELRAFRHPLLKGLRSFPVQSPFNRILLFYKSGQYLEPWRLMHGARNLQRRLLEPND